MSPNEIKEDDDPVCALVYEVGYLLVPTLSEEEAPREVTVIKDILEKEKAGVISEEFPKFRALAYAIRTRIDEKYQTFNNAYFGWIKFEATKDSIKSIKDALKHNLRIFRFLLIKTVREQTMVLSRPPRGEFQKVRKEAPKQAPPSVPISEAELDKSLEKIIAE